jgi:hypothetical protein
MNLYLVQCDFKQGSDAWEKIGAILNSHEGKRHRPDSWIILSAEPVSIIYEKLRHSLGESDFILITKIGTDQINNYPENIKNWIHANIA